GCSHSFILSERHGATAPSYTVRLLSGITKSGSIPSTLPKPSQVWQAPYGLLKLKKLTEGSSNTIPSSSKRSENTRSSPSPNFTRHSPCPSKKAVCTESAIRNCKSSSDL